jgi:NADP-dependent 3-hydroxy acid dehydrogenase YdfG
MALVPATSNISTGVEGRRVVVTGGSAGIGAATAALFARRGASVAIIGRDQDRLESVARSTGVLPISADIGNATEVSNAITDIAAKLGGIDCLINCAGAMLHSRVAEGRLEDWVTTFDVNVLGILYVTHASLPHLQAAGWADLVNVTSISARRASRPETSVYSASKAAATLLTDGLRAELAPLNIRVSAVLPGTTNTDGPINGIYDEAWRAEYEAYSRSRGIPAEAVAEEILHVVSLPRNAAIAEIVVRPFGEV